MNILKTKPAAVVLTGVIVVLASLWGAYRSLSELRQTSLDNFYSQTDTAVSIQAELEKIAATTSNLTVIAKRHLPQDDKLITQVITDKDDMIKAQSVGEKLAAFNKLSLSAFNLYDKIGQSNPQGKDEQYLMEWRANFYDSVSKISNNPYNKSAEEFNSTLKKFPTHTLSAATGVETLDLFY